jgi:hypothetical protein
VSPLFSVEPMTGIEPAYSAWRLRWRDRPCSLRSNRSAMVHRSAQFSDGFWQLSATYCYLPTLDEPEVLPPRSTALRVGASASTERFRCRPRCWNRRGGKATHHPSLRRAREVGGVADERGDGGNPVADQPIRTLAEPSSDLSTIGTADVPAHLAQFAAAYLSRPQMRRLAVIVSRWKGRHLAVTS